MVLYDRLALFESGWLQHSSALQGGPKDSVKEIHPGGQNFSIPGCLLCLKREMGRGTSIA